MHHRFMQGVAVSTLLVTGCTVGAGGTIAANAGAVSGPRSTGTDSGTGGLATPSAKPAPRRATPAPTRADGPVPGDATPAPAATASPEATPSPVGDAPAGNVRGRITAADGTPFVGKLVVERRAGDVNDPFMLAVRGLFAVTTLGLSEILGLFVRPFREVELHGDGAYAFEVAPDETRDDGAPYAFEVTAVTEEGLRVSQRVQLEGDAATLAPMRFWDGVDAPSSGATLDREAALALTPPADEASGYSVLIGPKDEEVSWYVRTADPSLPLPAYRFAADQKYYMRVIAHHEAYIAAAAPRAFTAGPADARELVAASIEAGDGSRLAGLADGDLVTRVGIGGSIFSSESDEIVIDLGDAKPLARLVAFAGKDAFPEVSYAEPIELYAADTTDAWGEAIATTQDKWFDLDLGGRSARYLKLKATGGTFALAELRVVAP